MDQSPNSVLPAPQPFPDSEKRNAKPKPPRGDEILRVKEGFTEISFRRYRSASCKNFSSRPSGVENKIELRRGSVYQSSKEIREMRKPEIVKGSTKIELSRSSNASFSFRIVDSSKVESKRNRLLNSDLSSAEKPSVEPNSCDNFIEICLKSGIKDRAVELDPIEELNFRCDESAGPLSNFNDQAMRLPKSHSAKVEMPMLDSLSQSEDDHSTRESSRGQFGHFRKMLDPFVKSKSLRSPLGNIAEASVFKEETSRDRTFCKALVNDFSYKPQNSALRSQIVNKDYHHLAVKSSPVHLHGCLKLDNKHGLLVFEFSLDCPEDVYVAKTHKSNNGTSWVYTFHSLGSRKKSNASITWGMNDSSRESSMVGQMQVSCYMCSELEKDASDVDNHMVTEFVLYDIAHAKWSVSVQENSSCPPDITKLSKASDAGGCELDDTSDAAKHKNKPRFTFEDSDLGASSEPIPWTAADLHPDLEIAAIIIQDPIEKRESLKYKRGDKIIEKTNLLGLPIVEEGKKQRRDVRSLEKLKVVIPAGNHGLPSNENCGPSPLLHRWRSGGGCDCGGWDMACPLVVFGNPSIQCANDQPLMDNHRPLELFIEGAKESIPALSMSYIEEGQYAVDFHARLSTLQAFAICVALLHNTEASGVSRKDTNIQSSQCNSLKMLIEDEVKFFVEAVTKEEKKKVIKTAKDVLPSYMPNPPFSPIARV